MTAIAATTGTVRSRVDGTLVMTIEFEPINAQDAFKLFATPGTQVAIAALLDGSYLAQKPEAPEPQREKMGDACYWTVMRCQEPSFWKFLNWRYALNVSNKDEASEAVKDVCDVSSRKEFDANIAAKHSWDSRIREPYRLFLLRQAL